MSNALYISTRGDDRSAGTSEKPMKTIAAAIKAGGPGCSVRMLPGDWGVVRITEAESGTPGYPTVIEGAIHSAPPVCGGDPANHGIQIIGPSGREHAPHDITIKYMIARGSWDGIKAHGSRLTIDHCTVEDAVHQGIAWHASGKDGVVGLEVNRCMVRRCGSTLINGVGQDHGMYVGGRGILIRDCTIEDCAAGYGLQVYPASCQVAVIGNTVRRCRATLVQQVPTDLNDVGLFVGNQFIKCGKSPDEWMDDIIIYGNPEKQHAYDPNEFGWGNAFTR